MGIVSKVVCKTVGLAGLSAVVYDAYAVGKHHAASSSTSQSADSYEHIISSNRTTTSESPVTNAIQNKVSDLRMNNPIIPAYGKVKGFIKGSLESLGDNIIMVGCTTLAMAGKGFFAKLGAWGVAGCGLYTVLREGFGFGKQSAVDR